MKSLVVIIAAVVILTAMSLFPAQQPNQPPAPPPPASIKLQPKPIDELASTKAKLAWSEMKNLQKDAKSVNEDYQNRMKDLQVKYGVQQAILEEYKTKVCKANEWKPEEVNYDPESDGWSKLPPKESPKSPETKK